MHRGAVWMNQFEQQKYAEGPWVGAVPMTLRVTEPAPERGLCTDCGVSRTDDAKRCGRACQFIQPDYPRLETQVHGRTRDASKGDERFFGPVQQMYQARLKAPLEGAQWTGILTTYPLTLLPLILVLHITYTGSEIAAVLKRQRLT